MGRGFLNEGASLIDKISTIIININFVKYLAVLERNRTRTFFVQDG